MKKLIALLAVFMMFTACDSDDDTNGGDDPILGTWYLADWDINGLPDPTDCNKESNITFRGDNTAESEFYGDVEGYCASSEDSGNWSKESNGEYTFEVPLVGERTGTVTFEGNNNFTFTIPEGSLSFMR